MTCQKMDLKVFVGLACMKAQGTHDIHSYRLVASALQQSRVCLAPFLVVLLDDVTAKLV